MSLAILHISDIHTTSSDTQLSTRIAAASAALESSDSVVTHVVILLSGDVADTGHPKEYEYAKEGLQILVKRIQAIRSIEHVSIFAIPGNHDCDLRGDQEIRDLIIAGKLSNPNEVLSDKKLGICLEPQANFYRFLSDLCAIDTSTFDYQVAPRAVIKLGHLSIGFLGLNTAIFSKVHEEPGKLVILNRALDTQHIPKCDLLICAIHHPVSWLTYDCMDRLKTFTRSRVDFLFSGHEHRRELFSKASLDGLGTVFCEAGAFSTAKDNLRSFFQICLIDVNNSKYKLRGFEWKTTSYRLTDDSGWQSLKTLKGGGGHRLPVSPTFRSFINDPGAQYRHPRVGNLRLGDFLIPPAVKSLDNEEGRSHVPFNLDETGIDRLLAKKGVTLVFASERFGKTTLAKLLFNDRYDRGILPLYIDLKEVSRFDDTVRAQMIDDAAKATYSIQDVNEYFAIDPNKRLLVLDNFGLAALTLDKQRQLVDSLHASFPRIIILGNELLKVQVASGRSFVPEGALAGVFEIEALSFKSREELIRKWCSAGELVREEENDIERKVHRSMELVGTVLGENLLPSTPFFVLAVLQLVEAETPVQTSNSGSYGFIYEYLITQALGKSRQVKDLNLKYSYLSELAYKMFVEGTSVMDEAELRLFHQEYLERKRIDCDYQKLKDDFLESQILENRDGFYSLKYRYLFYYFVARYIAERFHESEYRRTAISFVSSLHNENLFNVLVFLVYLVKDPALKDALIADAGTIFGALLPFDFSRDKGAIGRLGEIVDEVQFDEQMAATAKNQVYEQLTKHSQSPTPEANVVDRELEMLVQVNRAFKTVQLLGQTVKNFVGSMDGSEKVKFVETCFDLSLRTMTAMIDLLRESAPDVALETYKRMLSDSEVRAAKMRVSPVVKESDVYESARQTLYRHGQIMCLAVIKKVSLSIGSPELGPVYDVVISKRKNLGYDVMTVAIKLDHFSTLPLSQLKEFARPANDDPFFGGIVRRLALLHFYLFPVPERIRAEVCNLLSINFTATKHLALGSKKTLLTRGGQ